MNHAKGKRVLIVDDQQIVADSLKMVLRFNGIESQTAGSGPEGLDAFEPHKFAVVFTDFEMPGMNGHEFSTIIKARDPGQPVIMMTAYASTLDRKSLPHVDWLLEKPWTLDDLRTAIREVLPAQ